MTHQEIDLILNKKNDEVVEAHKEIIALQRGNGHIIKTGQKDLDYFLVGGLNNKMVFIGSRPSMGKTHHCETTMDNLLNEAINPNQNIAILRMNLEMQTKSLLLRDLKKSLGKKMIDIISTPYTELEKKEVIKVVNKHRDSRIINFSRIVEGEDLRYLLKSFCKTVDDRDETFNSPFLEAWNSLSEEDKILKPYVVEKVTQKIVLVDHLHIYQTKKQIDDVLSIFNEMKMHDSNLSFVVYFQFNRTLEEVWRDTKDKKANPKTFLPNSGHIYNTDSLMQYADLVMGMVVPQVVDMEEFVSVYKERNEHLKEHFIEGSSSDNTTVRLKGRNRIFYNYLKIRLVDDFEDSRLYCSVLNPEYEKTVNKLYEQDKNPFSVTMPDFKTPIFEKESIVPLASLNDAFGVPEKVENEPF
jgi:hypothetical protein